MSRVDSKVPTCSHYGRICSSRLSAAVCAVVAVVAVATAVVGCGEEETGSPTSDGRQPYLSVTEVESVLERTMLALVRTGGGDTSTDREGLVERVREADHSGREFELWVWSSPRIARRERPSLLAAAQEQHGDDARAIRAANVVAVFPDRPESVDVYRVAAEAISRLGAACVRGRDAPERLRRLCFGGDAVPPAGEGVDRDEAEGKGDAVVVDGLHYRPLVARRLNPNIVPDSRMVPNRRPPGKLWFGVFLRVCNETGKTRTASSRLALVNAFGARVKPVELPQSNPFAYDAQQIKPDNCLPREGSVTERAEDGALVLFAVDNAFLTNFPVALEVEGPAGKRERAVLDV